MTSIFVAKLDFNTTDDELKSLFEEYGKVNRVTIAKDRETGKPRGFAFVEMYDETEADAAIEALDNSTVNGRTIAVKKADDRGAKPAGGAPAARTDRPAHSESRPPRFDGPSEDGLPFKRAEESFKAPFSDALPAKTDRKKEKEKEAFGKKADKPKQHKMEAYKKSGKTPRFLDDEDDEDWTLNNRKSSAWDDEEEE